MTIDCWSCDTPNIMSRQFCVSCGSFIAVGSGASGATRRAAQQPLAQDPALLASADVYPGAPLEEAPPPFVEGAMALGPYSVAARRRATRRARTLTAVTSIVLAMVVGVAALYVASPLGDRGSEPRTAAGASAEPRPTPADLLATPADPSPTVATTPPADPPATEAPVAPVDGSGDGPPAEDDRTSTVGGVTVDPTPDPTDTAPSERDLGTLADNAPAARTDDAPSDVRSPTEPPEDAVSASGGWVCDGPVQVEDSRARAWSLGRVSFRVRPGFERVVLHLERAGQGSGQAPSVTAESIATARLNSLLPGVRRPALGRNTIGLHLADGIDANLGLRGYRPNGLARIKEFSVHPAAGGDSNVLISTSSEGCFRLRVPAWSDPSNSLRRAQILVDIRS
jgi:hypothetical protein